MRPKVILWFGLLTLSLGLLGFEPSLAGNKFEVIGSGVSGVHALRRDHLRIILFAVSAILFVSAFLAIVVPHKNPLFMNFANWRQSAMIFAIMGALFVLAAALL